MGAFGKSAGHPEGEPDDTLTGSVQLNGKSFDFTMDALILVVGQAVNQASATPTMQVVVS